MCGICGIYEPRKDNRKLMSQMLDVIQHRGPDSKNQFQHNNITLGHRRLSIIDLNTGNQPIFNEDKSLAIIFNGEIYNFLEIKNQLKNHQFYTHSDTEVLIHAYEEWGIDFLSKLNGIFAFCIYDFRKNVILLARDHFGIKPLHYFHKGELFIFGSEQKSIILHPKYEKKLNLNALHSQLNLRYTQGDETLFAGIKRLPPASYLIFKNNEIIIKKYWKLTPKIDHKLTEESTKEKINYHIKKAVKRQLLSDVPIGVYLSGGLDSSTIVQKMYEIGTKEINTFTLGFNEPTDEFADAKMIANYFHTNHFEHSLSLQPLASFPEVIRFAEEPKINLLQGYNMSAFAKNHVKVILGGLGGDELFAGYDIHKILNPVASISNYVPRFLQQINNWKSELLFKIQNYSRTLKFDEYRRGIQMLLNCGNLEKAYLIARNVWEFDTGMYKNVYSDNFLNSQKNLKKISKEFDILFYNNLNLKKLDKILYAEFNSKMINDYLLVEDRMSMSHSIEERVPFLDIDLVNFGFSIPVEMKIKYGKTKYLFREAMKDKLPNKIIRKKKWGFTVNPYIQFKKDLKFYSERILTKNFVEQQNIFNYKYIKRILDHPADPRLRWHYNYLWIVLGIAIWEKMFIKSDLFKKTRFDIEEFYN